MKLQHADWYHHLSAQGKEILQKLQNNGFTTYVVGGAVRDLLLGKEPKDFDFVTDAKPDDISALFSKTIDIGRSFGISMVVIDDIPIEVASFRKESSYSDSRHPKEVLFATPEEDAIRRDLTINALFWDPVNKNIIDYVGGLEDIQKKIIRTVGDAEQRFSEDNLRMLRALRFLSELSPHGFTLEENTRQAIFKLREKIKNISKERITQELNLALQSSRPSICFEEIKNLELWSVLFEGEAPSANIISSLDFAKASWLGTGKASPGYFWAILLFESIFVEKNLGRLVLHREEKLLVLEILRFRKKFLDDLEALPLADKKLFLASPYFFPTASLLTCLNQGEIPAKISELIRIRKDFEEKDSLNPPPLISGKDLEALGLKPGKEFKEILWYVRKLQLEEIIYNKEMALNAVMGKLGRK